MCMVLCAANNEAPFCYMHTFSLLCHTTSSTTHTEHSTVHIGYKTIGCKAKSVIRPMFALFFVPIVDLLIDIIEYTAISLIRPIFAGLASGILFDMYCICKINSTVTKMEAIVPF